MGWQIFLFVLFSNKPCITHFLLEIYSEQKLLNMEKSYFNKLQYNEESELVDILRQKQ